MIQICMIIIIHTVLSCSRHTTKRLIPSVPIAAYAVSLGVPELELLSVMPSCSVVVKSWEEKEGRVRRCP